eukprot:CAMPEP_0172483640 /NCGR_PEP_ID=MMETSP1066-20121228/10686_1 /TAXON_ID=671091 /ORGANISM="Coscinodiscus wailesii, Strain CCMP2513" /LENGTH=482 /DNA_ID=CAMNT_0013247613 /DNA_START=26 /DNA_END=1474 /DNA_ORIENTATION=+
MPDTTMTPTTKANGANGDATKKQGAYGKIKTHKEPKLQQLLHVDEVLSAISFLYIKPLKSNLSAATSKLSCSPSDLAFCDEILGKVSRSFAAVIRQLPPSLLADVLIFYLVLRALDTIEDDMTAFATNEEKVSHLLKFTETALTDKNWSMEGVGEGDEATLLQQFPKCHAVYQSLPEGSRVVIGDITRRMAEGMAEFVGKDLGQGTTDLAEYNRYCHFVAGLVGEGLSRLFAATGLEDEKLSNELFLSDQMGLFLQKTNIIRDYLEDYVDGRAFWPQSIWKKYTKGGNDLGFFREADNGELALHCLNELVSDALELVPDCLKYLSKLKTPEVFRFCAIPQVMAIATLDKLYNNHDVFTGVVKIRKGMSCKLILNTNDVEEVHDTFFSFARSIKRSAESAKARGFKDPSYHRTISACDTITVLTKDAANKKNADKMMKVLLLVGATFTSFSYIVNHSESHTSTASVISMVASLFFAAPIMYML